jgi:FkbM family methyltransferase
VVELGGCIGVVACITNRLLTDPKAHIVIEANPSVVPLLEENRVLNHCKFEVVNAAIAYGIESIAFTPARDWWVNSLRQERKGEAKVVVSTTSLRALIDRHKFDSFTLICDIEGHEFDLISNEEDTIRQATTIILETHPHIIGEAKTMHLLARIRELGFRIVDQGANVFVMTQLRF